MLSFNELCKYRRIVFDKEYSDFDDYISDYLRIHSCDHIFELRSKYVNNQLSDEYLQLHLKKRNSHLLKYYVKVFLYCPAYDKRSALIILIERFKKERSVEIYDVIKMLILFFNLEDLMNLLDNDEVLSMLIGEYGRKNNLEFDVLISNNRNIPQKFLNYCIFNELVLEGFKDILEKNLEKDINILLVLPSKNEDVIDSLKSILRCEKYLQFYVLNCDCNYEVLLDLVSLYEYKTYSLFLIAKAYLKNNVKYFEKLLFLLKIDKLIELVILLPDDVLRKYCRIILKRIGNTKVPNETYLVLGKHLSLEKEGPLDFYVNGRNIEGTRPCIINRNEIEEQYQRFVVILEKEFTKEFCEEVFNVKKLSESNILNGCYFVYKDYTEKMKDLYLLYFISIQERLTGNLEHLRATSSILSRIEKEIFFKDETDFLDFHKKLQKKKLEIEFDCFIKNVGNLNYNYVLRLPEEFFIKVLNFSNFEPYTTIKKFHNSVLYNHQLRIKLAEDILKGDYKKEFVEYLRVRNIYLNVEGIANEDNILSFKNGWIANYVLNNEDKKILSRLTDYERLKDIISILYSKNKSIIHKHLINEKCIEIYNELSKTKEIKSDATNRKVSLGDNYISKRYKYKREYNIDNVHNTLLEEDKETYVTGKYGEEDQILYEVFQNIKEVHRIKGCTNLGLLNKHILLNLNNLERTGYVISYCLKNNEDFKDFLNTVEYVIEDKVTLQHLILYFIMFCKFEVDFCLVKDFLEEYIRIYNDGLFLTVLLTKVNLEDIDILIRTYKNSFNEEIIKGLMIRCTAFKMKFYNKETTSNEFISSMKIDNCVKIKVRNSASKRDKEFKIHQSRRNKINEDVMYIKPAKYEIENFKIYFYEINDCTNTLESFYSSSCTLKNLIFVNSYDILRETNSSILDLDINKFLESKDDQVIENTLPLLSDITDKINNKLMDILYKCGKLDGLGVKVLKTINIELLEKEDVDRIYEMFFLDPRSYIMILPRIIKRGYEITVMMIQELLYILKEEGDKNVISIINEILKLSVINETLFVESLIVYEYSIFIARKVIIGYLRRYEHKLSLKMYVKISEVIGNEDNLELLCKLLDLIKDNKEYESLITKWKSNKKLSKLLLRMYPIFLGDKEFYKNIYRNYYFEEEEECLVKFYDPKLNYLKN